MAKVAGSTRHRLQLAGASPRKPSPFPKNRPGAFPFAPVPLGTGLPAANGRLASGRARGAIPDGRRPGGRGDPAPGPPEATGHATVRPAGFSWACGPPARAIPDAAYRTSPSGGLPERPASHRTRSRPRWMDTLHPGIGNMCTIAQFPATRREFSNFALIS